MLAESLKGVISQMLCKKIGGGRVPVLEILIGTPPSPNLIRGGEDLPDPVDHADGQEVRNVPDERELRRPREEKIVEPQEAYAKAFDKPGLVNMFKKAGIDTSWAPREPGRPAAASTTA
jgi:twitching motility protein PilT